MSLLFVFVYAFVHVSGSENKSVVLASTAIQLLDERKSPIAAGKRELKCVFLDFCFTPTHLYAHPRQQNLALLHFSQFTLVSPHLSSTLR